MKTLRITIVIATALIWAIVISTAVSPRLLAGSAACSSGSCNCSVANTNCSCVGDGGSCFANCASGQTSECKRQPE